MRLNVSSRTERKCLPDPRSSPAVSSLRTDSCTFRSYFPHLAYLSFCMRHRSYSLFACIQTRILYLPFLGHQIASYSPRVTINYYANGDQMVRLMVKFLLFKYSSLAFLGFQQLESNRLTCLLLVAQMARFVSFQDLVVKRRRSKPTKALSYWSNGAMMVVQF